MFLDNFLDFCHGFLDIAPIPWYNQKKSTDARAAYENHESDGIDYGRSIGKRIV